LTPTKITYGETVPKVAVEYSVDCVIVGAARQEAKSVFCCRSKWRLTRMKVKKITSKLKDG